MFSGYVRWNWWLWLRRPCGFRRWPWNISHFRKNHNGTMRTVSESLKWLSPGSETRESH